MREVVDRGGLGLLVYEDGVDAKSPPPGPPYKQIGSIGQEEIGRPDRNYQLGAPENQLMGIPNWIPPSRVGRIRLSPIPKPSAVRILVILIPEYLHDGP